MDSLSKTLAGIAIVCFGILGADTLSTFMKVLNYPQQVQAIDNLPAFEEPSPEDMRDKTKNEALVSIEVNGRFQCSATVISNRYVLTAAHCLVEGSSRSLIKRSIKIISLSGESVEAKAAAVNLRADYGLITGDFTGFNKFPIDTDPAHDVLITDPMAQLLLCGFPWGATRVCYGTQSPVQKYYEFLAVAGQLYPGMSGGPVINRNTNMIVAVNSAVTNGAVIVAPIIGLFETLGVEVK